MFEYINACKLIILIVVFFMTGNETDFFNSWLNYFWKATFYREENIEGEESTSSHELEEEQELILKHFAVLKDIENTKFITKEYHCTYSRKYKNEYVNIETCFCKICGNYICCSTSPVQPIILCSHYKLIDSLNTTVGEISGHIHSKDEMEVLSTIDSIIRLGSHEESQIYRAKLGELVYDQDFDIKH